MIRCKPLLGTYVEISTNDSNQDSLAIDLAFSAIEQVQLLMGFHDPQSELTRINCRAHLEPIHIHPWTARVLTTAQEIYQFSDGLFNCGIGQHLMKHGVLPKIHTSKHKQFGGIESLHFVSPLRIQSHLPLCLDLGGIAKGFAVDMAVQRLQEAGAGSGYVNAGGDIRVFGENSHPIHIRNPSNPSQYIHLGQLQDGAIATSGLYFAKQGYKAKGHMIHPITRKSVNFSGSYSVITQECLYADALTKVVSLSGDVVHPCLQRFTAQAIRMTAP